MEEEGIILKVDSFMLLTMLLVMSRSKSTQKILVLTEKRNSSNNSYGRGFSGRLNHNDYTRVMSVIHDQYNQILQMLGHTNTQGGTEGSASQSNNAGGVNLVQDY